jgi:predicted phosphoadenosine phosphosulfate sulfurtransferase
LKKEYLPQNVYEATQERLAYLFREFENVYVSFSGGKDSGLLLNLVLDYRRKHAPDRTVGVFHQDFEAQYTVTTEYITRTFERIKDEVDPYWVCLPMATRTALSSYEMFWYPWDDKKSDQFLHRDRPLANIYVNNQKVLFCIT